MLNQTVKELILMSRRPQDLVLALSGIGITPRFASWSLREAAEAVGLNPRAVERRLGAFVEGV